jgi:hypothetical protein
MGKKVLRYTEDEFVQLLENIVKKVKKEERLQESRKESRKKRLAENLERIRANKRRKRR